MSFASEKDNPRAERFYLVRLTPARYVGDDLSADGGGVYSMDWSLPIAKVERNGTELTEVSSTPGSNDEWYHDEDAGTLEIKLASAPDEDSNVIVVFYYLFFTGERPRTATEDPENSSTPNRRWEPRIKSHPKLKQSFASILGGVFSVQSTALRLINTDFFFTEYLTDNDSFSKKNIDIWACIDSTSNSQKLFNGKVASLRLDNQDVLLDITDAFSDLQKPCFMGDSAGESYFKAESGSFPNMDPTESGTPCPYICGEYSRYKEFVLDASSSYSTDLLAQEAQTLFKAVNVNYSATRSLTTNRKWGLCRVNGGLASQSWGTIEATTTDGGLFYARFSSYSNVNVGDTISWTESGTRYYATIFSTETFTHSAVTYNLVFGDGNGNERQSGETFTTSSTMHSMKALTVSIVEPTSYTRAGKPLWQGFDYTLSETSTSGGHTYLEITLSDTVEDDIDIGDQGGIDTSIDEIRYRVQSATPESHADALKKICEASGLTTKDSTFTSAESSFTANCYFSIPQFDEFDYKSYLEYAEDISRSALGYLALNIDSEVEYHLLEAPSSSDATDENEYLNNSLSVDVEYQDIVTEIIAYNPHRAENVSGTSSETSSSAKAEYLHGVRNVIRFRHVLDDISSRISAILAVRSNRRSIYSFSTVTKHLDSDLGDDINLESSLVLGSGTSKSLKVITIDKSPDKTSVEATDLLDLS